MKALIAAAFSCCIYLMLYALLHALWSVLQLMHFLSRSFVHLLVLYCPVQCLHLVFFCLLQGLFSSDFILWLWLLSIYGHFVGASIMCWCKGLNCCSLFLLCPFDAVYPTSCLMVCFAVNAFLKWVSCALTGIVLFNAMSTFGLFFVTFSYMVKPLAFKTLCY